MTLTDQLSSFIKGLTPNRPGALGLLELQERILPCLPPTIQRALAERNRALVVRVDGPRADLDLITGLERQRVGELDLDHSALLPAAVAEHDKDQRLSVELRLPHDAVLTRVVAFPAQVRGNLAQVIRYEIDRLTPFQAEDVYFDFTVQAGAKSASRVSVDLAVCRRDAVEHWVKRLRELGSPVGTVAWDGAWPGANLLPPAERPTVVGLKLSPEIVLSALAALLAILVLITPILQKRQQAEALEQELRRLHSQAVVVDDLRQELETARQGSTAVLQKKLAEPPLLKMLTELTDRLPEDTWIQNLELNGDQVDLRGESGQATALIAILEQAPGIDAVSFKSPVTQVARTGKERFNISFKYVPPKEQ